MDYEKKYKEALAHAREIHRNEDEKRRDMEFIFPELKESEDERIRKWLVDTIKAVPNDSIEWEIIDKSDIIAWLEKQGEQKSIDKEYTFKSIPRLLDMIEPTDRAKSYCKKLIDSLQTEGYSIDAKIVGECLKQMNGEKVAMAVMDIEKQGEQKPNPYTGTSFEYNGHNWGMCARDNGVDILLDKQLFKHLEKQDEQKPADKVEPKFKVKYAGNEYNVLDIKENMGMTWYGIEDEPNHIDYVKANSCEIINVYGIKENGSPYPTKPAIFAGHNPSDEDMKEALRTEYEKGRADAIAEMEKPTWSEDDEKRLQSCINILKAKSLMGKVDTANTMWLKSLKQRIGG